MNIKFTLVFFAMATLLLQHSHCIPTHRNARGAPKGEIFNKIKEYVSQYQSGGSNAPTSSEATSSSSGGVSGSSESTYTQTETSSGTEKAASAPEPSVVARDTSTSSSASSSGFGNPFSNYNSYIPAQYQNQIPSSCVPNQFGQYIPSNSPGSSSSSTTPTGAASEQDFTVAAKEGSSSSSASSSGFGNPFSNYNSYIPAQYQNQIPSSCVPNQFGQYIPSNSAGSSTSTGSGAGAGAAASR